MTVAGFSIASFMFGVMLMMAAFWPSSASAATEPVVEIGEAVSVTKVPQVGTPEERIERVKECPYGFILASHRGSLYCEDPRPEPVPVERDETTGRTLGGGS